MTLSPGLISHNDVMESAKLDGAKFFSNLEGN